MFNANKQLLQQKIIQNINATINIKKKLPDFINLLNKDEEKNKEKNKEKKDIKSILKKIKIRSEKSKENRKIAPKINNNEICALLVFSRFSIDYTLRIKTFNTYGLNVFRYVSPDNPLFPDYTFAVNTDDEEGACLRTQLAFGFVRYYPLDFLFILLVPLNLESDDVIKARDDVRNYWFAFCLNIEKSFLYFNQQKLTCNNEKIIYETYIALETYFYNNEEVQYFISAIASPLVQIDQAAMYSIATSSISFVTGVDLNKPINPATIIKILYDNSLITDLPIPSFYDIIYFTYSLLTFLFSTSNKLLQGKETGLPKEFIDLFFPLNRQLYYYNLYYTWIQSRQRYLGFGDKINSSNGDGTYLAVPNFNAYPFKQFS